VISACYSTKNGAVRVIDAQAGATCGRGENPLAWSAGPVVDAHAASGFASVDMSNYMTVATLSLPAGSYVITGHGQSQNPQAGATTISCNHYGPNSALIDASTTTLPTAAVVGAASYGTLAFAGAITLASAGSVHVECISGGPETASFNVSARLVAVTVASIS
jgi:hypothetical protein